jgi:multimeric flavodoxin WrbA
MARSNNGATVRVLGISGSPRQNGNTDRVVDAVVAHLARQGGVDAEFYGLARRDVNLCTGCVEVCHPGYSSPRAEAARSLPWTLCRHSDAITELLGKMAGADVILIGSPVYFGDVSGLLKTLMDRSTSLIEVGEDGRYGSALAGKTGGAIAVGGARHGGQEATLEQIFTYFLLLQIVPVDFSEYGDQCHGVACVAALPGEIERDDWNVPVVGTPTSSLQQAKLYGEKLIARASARGPR